MKRILCMVLFLSLFMVSSLADPLVLLDDYVSDISEPYDVNDPSAGTFVFSCRYPHADTTAEGGSGINSFYEYQLSDTLSNLIPMLQDAYEGHDYSMIVSYSVTCNNDDYFSVLVRTEKNEPDFSQVMWDGQVFSRKQGMGGATCSLPNILGILDPEESEEWLQDYHTETVETLIRAMVWDIIEENGNHIDYGGLTEEDLDALFFPSEDFYLDENGDPVFYLQPGDIFEEVAKDAGPLIFSISLEDILDEL